jgi:ATP/ADP translocase
MTPFENVFGMTPFEKVFGMQLANILSTEALFYACIFPFIAFFGSFAFIMYPLRDVLHPTSESDFSDSNPPGISLQCYRSNDRQCLTSCTTMQSHLMLLL